MIVRDELIGKARTWAQNFDRSKGAERLNSAYYINALADELAAAAPRTITTAEELDALPGGSLILDALDCCREAAKLTDGNVWRSMGPASVRSSRQLPLPAKVLYVPEVTP